MEHKNLIRVSKDFVFKRLFGAESHKRVLVCLLNSILKDKPHIESIELLNTELTKDIEGGKSPRLDIRARTDDETIVNIEMQCSDKGNLINRSSFCQARMMPQEIKEGDSYDSIPNMIAIWIVADYKATNRKHHTHEAMYMYKDNGIDPIEIASDKLRTFIIELEKIEFKRVHHADMFSVWMMFIKNPESIPEEFLSIPEVKEAMEELTFLSHDPEFREEYEARQRLINDANAEKTIAVKKAKEEGKAEGELKKAKEMVVGLLQAGVSVDVIAQTSGFSVEEINLLKG